MDTRNNIVYLVTHIVLLAFLFTGCGGGGGGGTTVTSIILNKIASEQAVSASLSAIDLLLEPSYLGAAGEETKKKSVIEKLMLPELAVRDEKDGIKAAGLFETIPCSTSGSKTVSMTYLGTPEAMLNVHAVVTYTACIEGSSSYNGTLDTTMEGPVTMPTKVTSKLTDFSYKDVFTGTSLSFKAATITMDSAQYYASGGIKSAAITISGDVSGTLYDKYLYADFKAFKLKYEYGTTGLLYVNLIGNFKIPCIASELSVLTPADVALLNNELISGSFYISTADGKEKATAGINDKGEITITGADGTANRVTDINIESCKGI